MYSSVKRCFDLCAAVTLLCAGAPLLVFVVLLLITDRTGQGIFADAPERVGKDGRLFRMYKFRTMKPHTNRWRKEVEPKVTIRDPRVTKLGKVLRGTDLDELPQLLHVIRGEMSLVGPRPYFEAELESIRSGVATGEEIVGKILSVRPGMTGLWQISGRNDLDLKKRAKIDAVYAERLNLFTDVHVLLGTPWAVITRKGAR